MTECDDPPNACDDPPTKTYLWMCMYRNIQHKLERRLLPFFQFVQDDMKQNTAMIFVYGILGGGILGMHATAFGLSFGLNCIDFPFVQIVSSLIGVAAMSMGEYRLIGIFFLASVLFEALHTRKIAPYTAYGLTLGIICSVLPSFVLATWINAMYFHLACQEWGCVR